MSDELQDIFSELAIKGWGEDVDKIIQEIERLKEQIKKWQDIATRINNENNKLHSIIKEAIEYINENAITNISWLGTKTTKKELFKDNASLYELLEILRGEE